MGIADHSDHFSPDYFTDPLPLWKRMHDEEPVARSEGGYYLVTRYDLIREAAGDPARFLSTRGMGIPLLPIVGMIPIDIDPPDQREYRRILNPAFNVETVNNREDEIRELVVELIDPLASKQQFDATQELSSLLPPRATLDFIAFPRAELRVALEECLTRIGPFELVDPDSVVWVGGATRGIKNLPLRRVGSATRARAFSIANGAR